MGLTGTIPPELGNLSFLVSLDMRRNYFHGNLPKELSRLRRLRFIRLSSNNFTGEIPMWFGHFPELQILLLYKNNFNGPIPSSISNLSKLEHLDFDGNSLRGKIPEEIGNLHSLKFLSLQDNELVGSIPLAMFNISTLEYVAFTFNNLSGTLPADMCRHLPNLKAINLSFNQIHGQIPSSLSQCSQLEILSLEFNNFSGTIPKEIGNLEMLQQLYLTSNNLHGVIPQEIGNLRNLKEFGIRENQITGSIPKEIGNLTMLTLVVFSHNFLAGDIPATIGDLLNLQNLSLEHNLLQESIPGSFGNMLSLTSLDFSNNSLSGLIPKSLEELQSLKVLDVSFNHLRGEIPSGGPFRNFTSESFISNDALCGDPKFHVPPCQTNPKHSSRLKKVLLLAIILPGIAVMVVLALTVVFLRYQKKNKIPTATDVLPVTTTARVSYYELLQATNGYSESNLLGSGSFGSVYKAILNDERIVAVKVFNLLLEGADKSFYIECDIFCNLRHRNLVKVVSSCTNHDFKALALEYICNGSLEKWLYSPNYMLNILQRLDIMIDVAKALQYLHNESSTPVIHCDLKPSNVLIDGDIFGHVSDFGIARFLGKEESTAFTKTLATIGSRIAIFLVECGLEGLVSTASDVYSYGILLMEVFTRRRPSDEMFDADLNVKSWVEGFVPNAILQVIDANLLMPDDEPYAKKLECLSSIMKLALNCVPESPKDRLSMKVVVDTLQKIKTGYLECHGGK